MYGLGMQGMRPGSARMMRPHNPLMNMAVAHHLARGGLACLAEGGQPGDAPRERLHGGTMSKISPQFTIGAVLRNLGILGPKAAVAAPPGPVVAAPPASTVPVTPDGYASGGEVRGYDDGGVVSPTGGSPSGVSPLMQMLLQGAQRTQASPAAPTQPGLTPAPGTAPQQPARPFSLPGNAPLAAPQSMVPQRPIQPGLMQGRPMTPPSPVSSGQPIVPYMNPGISAPGYAHGGSTGGRGPITSDISRHVQGPGGGQEDLIDAKLSDGEWIGDATFVSDVGDGSNKEGARRLDRLRDLVAEHKGRQGRYAPETPPLEKLAKNAGILGSKKPVKKAKGGALSSVRSDRLPETYGTSPTTNADLIGVRG